MNQLFLFKRINRVPSVFSDIRFNSINMDRPLISYAAEEFGRELMVSVPLDMLDAGLTVKRVYPFDVDVGVIDDLRLLKEEHLERVRRLDYAIFVVEDIDELVAARSLLRSVTGQGAEFKKYVILKAREGILSDDLILFLNLSRIYGYRPVIRASDLGVMRRVPEILMAGDVKYCRTKWFGHSVQVMFVRDPRVNGPVILMSPDEGVGVDLLIFKDVYALLCRKPGQPTISSIITYIYQNSRPLLQVGDIVVDNEFIEIVEALARHGSIRSAGKSLGIPYAKTRKVIKDLQRLERALGTQLIEVRRGGAEHGRTEFTREGEIVIQRIKSLYGLLVREFSKEASRVVAEVSRAEERPLCIFPLLV